VHTRARAATTLAWIFSLVSVADIVTALALGLGTEVFRQPLGVAWFVLTFYVPAVCVSQTMILVMLTRRRSAAASAPAIAFGMKLERRQSP
jgi:hypothetical protein